MAQITDRTETKQRVAELTRQKISIQDQLQFTSDIKQTIKLEGDLYELNHTIDILLGKNGFPGKTKRENNGVESA